MTRATRWGTDFDPDRLAALETRMWKAYYRRQPARLFGPCPRLRAQARVSWPRALAASLLLTRAAAGFARATGDYERFAPDIGRAYRLLGLPDHVDAEAVARHELRWWVVRREIGLAAGTAAGESITRPVRGPVRRPARAGRGGRAGCAGSPPRSAIAARPPIRTVRGAGQRLLARGRRGCCEPHTAASRPGSRQPISRSRQSSTSSAARPRSSGRPGDGRPATRRPGRCPAATSSLAASQARNGVRPLAIVSHRRSCPVTTFSHGRPIA